MWFTQLTRHDTNNCNNKCIRLSNIFMQEEPSTSNVKIFYHFSEIDIYFLGLLIHVLNQMVGYNCFIIFQYYYLNIKILKLYEILENWKR
jgi:hypothetical protein